MPPLKASSLLLIWIGACFGEFDLDVGGSGAKQAPSLQIFSALAEVWASSWPALQAGIPRTSIVPFLSVSITTSLIAGGWVPSAVPILPETLSVIGSIVVFESALGVTPPLKGEDEVAGLDRDRLLGCGERGGRCRCHGERREPDSVAIVMRGRRPPVAWSPAPCSALLSSRFLPGQGGASSARQP